MPQAATQFVNHGAVPLPPRHGAQAADTRHQTQPVAAELQAVLLPRYGAGNILGPGQLVPIWDIGAWERTTTPFELQGYFACLADGAFVCGNNDQQLDVLESIVLLEESGRVGTDLSQQRTIAATARAVLSDVGGVATIRPDSAPIGMIPFAGRDSLGGPAIELQDMTALDFYRMSRGLNKTNEAPPEICFFAASPQGTAMGWDVVDEAKVRVFPIPGLPASFYAAQDAEMGLIKKTDLYGDVYRTSMLAAVSSMLQGLSITTGIIYASFAMGTTPAEEKHWELSDVGNDVELPLYALPWVEEPLHVLNPGARAAAQAMLRGDYRRAPMPRATLLRR
jgi:hypothetical protein